MTCSIYMDPIYFDMIVMVMVYPIGHDPHDSQGIKDLLGTQPTLPGRSLEANNDFPGRPLIPWVSWPGGKTIVWV